jgi:hypothetical protein
MTAKINKIEINVSDGPTVWLTPEQVKELRDVLNELYPKEPISLVELPTCQYPESLVGSMDGQYNGQYHGWSSPASPDYPWRRYDPSWPLTTHSPDGTVDVDNVW